jgi:DNA replication and repair protein RecF
MSLTKVEIADFRNITAIKFEPLALGFNLLYGHNGSGKTSLLEAIYYLSLGRSFRTPSIARVIRNTADKFVIFAQMLSSNNQVIPVGIERQQQGNSKIRIAGNDVQSVAELADLTPLQLINSQCYNLLCGAPLFRRKYLDWGVFYRNNHFLEVWRDFGQILKQRNAALRTKRPQKELDIWSQELTVKAQRLDQCRQEYIELLFPLLKETLAELITLHDLEITYQSGWDPLSTYADVLANSYEKDMHLGYTQYGPHRADFKIKIKRIEAKDILSRGQQKLFVCAMILAQGALLSASVNKKPIYLIDDLPAELDVVSRSNLITLLSKQETQVFVTAVEKNALSNIISMLPLKMFHVEHGNLTEVMQAQTVE